MTIITTQDLKKTFQVRSRNDKQSRTVEAVRSISFSVEQGEVFGFLGPNGAGKSTTQRMLTTLLKPTGGQATIAGCDLIQQPEQVRRHIGYVGQAGGTDDSATAYENLMLQAQLYGQTRSMAQQRSQAMISALQLDEFAHRPVKTYSGGQRRRLAIALALIHQPAVLFLDEPTTGLDPQVRVHLWDEIKKLRDQGTTVFLTTHYLEEADNLADRLAIIDHGEIVTQGTPAELKHQLGGDIITLTLESTSESQETSLETVRNQLQATSYVHHMDIQQQHMQLYVQNGDEVLPEILHVLDATALKTRAVSLSRPTLDDVFLRHTGRSLREPVMQ